MEGINPSKTGPITTSSEPKPICRKQLNETRFGMCGCYPDWIQRLATPKMFLVAFCIKNVIQGMVFSYLIGIQTSVERHFKFDASSMGLLQFFKNITVETKSRRISKRKLTLKYDRT